MAVKLRLTRVGKTKQPQYRIVAADSRSPRDGRFIEIVGHYNPRTDPSTLTRRQRQGRQVAAAGRPADRPGAQAARDLRVALEHVPATPPKRRPTSAQRSLIRARARADDADECTRRRRRQRGAGADRDGRAHPHRALDRRRPRRRPGRRSESRGRVRLDVRVGPGDLGRVIGRRGRTAQSIRTVVRAAAARDDVDVDVEFLDD